MKQTIGMIFACVLVASMAFGMGKVGAEEEVQVTPTPVPQARIEIQKKQDGVEIQFIDKANNVLAKKELKGEITSGYRVTNRNETYYLTKPNSNAIVINYLTVEKQSPEVIYETGRIYKNRSRIEYYDVEGKLVFVKQDVEYEAARISTLGNYLTCYKGHAFRDDLYDYEVKKSVLENPPGGTFYILNLNGDIVYQFNNSVDVWSIKFSSDDKWILFKSSKYQLINTSVMKVEAEFEGTLIGAATIEKIYKDGKMLLIKGIHPRKRIYETSVLDPFSRRTVDIGLLDSNQLKEYKNNTE